MSRCILPGLFAVILAVMAGASTAPAQETPDRRAVLACVTGLQVSTTWDQCLNLMFAPCATADVGSAAHLACLNAERNGWEKMMATTRADLSGRLTATGASDLTTLMGEWIGYVTQKCAAAGAQFTDISADAAQTGCEISELVGLTEELDACVIGNSTAPYCALRE